MAESTVRLDMLDFPTAWQIQRDGVDHDPRCSSVPGWHRLSGPGNLCDCGAVRAEWERRRRDALGVAGDRIEASTSKEDNHG